IGKPAEYLVPHVGRCFQNALRYHSRLFNYQTSERVTVFLEDFGDYGNAGAAAIPNNYIRLGIAPLNYVFETAPANERINHTMNHEMVHIVANDKPAGNDKLFRKIFFGKPYIAKDDPISMFYSYFTNPRRYSPRWYHEGIAVFLETWMAGGIGRAMGGYDEMVFRTMVRDHAYIYDVVGLESEGTTIDFQIGVNSYLYGTRFMSYLAYWYGPQKLIEWVSRSYHKQKYFAAGFRAVYGKSLDEAWSKWIEWEHQFQKANLDSIGSYPTTPYRRLTRKALGSVSRSFYDKVNHKIYSAILYPGNTAHLAAIDIACGSIKKLCEVRGAGLYYVTSLAYDPNSNLLFYATDNTGWRDLNVYNLATGKSRMLMKDAHIGDLAFNRSDQSIWGIRHYNGISTIVRIGSPYKQWNQIYSWPYGKDMYAIDVSPEGKYLTGALAEVSGRQLLIRMSIDSLLKGDGSYKILFDFENSNPSNFTFSEDGKYLFGSSYYSGVSNIFRYELEKDDMVALSNCETGFFRPLAVSEDSLVVFRYTGDGFVPVMIPNRLVERVGAIRFLGNEIAIKYPVVKSWIADSPGKINIDSSITRQGDYRPVQSLGLSSAYPVLEGYKDFISAGVRLNFLDPLGVVEMNLKGSYSPNLNVPQNERAHFKASLRYWNWKMTAAYNRADFYDLFGPTKTSRKGYSVELQYNRALIYEKPKSLDIEFKIAGFGNLERLPEFQNVRVSFDKFYALRANLEYSYLKKTLGAVDYEEGLDWRLSSINNYVNRKIFPRFFVNLGYGFLLPVKHSSIWLRTSSGYSFGNQDEPFANFYFGGFGNNWIDYQETKRYREYYSFPGVEIDDIGGTNYAKLQVEWELPPIRFRRFGTTGIYLRWARFAFFSTAIRTNIDRKSSVDPARLFGFQRSLLDTGGQIDFRFILFSHLKTTFSLGLARAFEESRKPLNEFMISIKIL
ncbi:MAG: WD40 repeat domain-containing protein, partial [Calditrichia bacterium]